ncbi:hypothetical protein DFH08DRAFT_1083886 [Mycena albidolilacea]|uniref:Uncharacterized protein n=1 Tax=Mycena albidolilacea TaxID=1033008 RepID=A0AAD7EKA4_9AGAR|nr:hypothetical protein DFH08DRAFT_1083886 [Mycena albidolilacea]
MQFIGAFAVLFVYVGVAVQAMPLNVAKEGSEASISIREGEVSDSLISINREVEVSGALISIQSAEVPDALISIREAEVAEPLISIHSAEVSGPFISVREAEVSDPLISIQDAEVTEALISIQSAEVDDGIKRSAEDNLSPTRASKVAKTDKGNTSKSNNSGDIIAKKTVPTTDDFKSKALPLHLTLTHTPPTVADTDTVVASLDPGHLSDLSLVPTSFKTGSYGWKGNKRLTVELVGAEVGEVDRVTVVLTINAIVVGSKAANKEKEKKDGRPPTGEGVQVA